MIDNIGRYIWAVWQGIKWGHALAMKEYRMQRSLAKLIIQAAAVQKPYTPPWEE